MTTGTQARSPADASVRLGRKARAHMRRFLSRAKLRTADLDAIEYETLRGWAEAKAAGEWGAARLQLADLREMLRGRMYVPTAARVALGGDPLEREEREELRALEAEAQGDQLLLHISKRARLRSLREKARGDAAA